MKWARWWVPFLGALLAAAVSGDPVAGEWETEVTQGEVSRVSSRWSSGDAQARWWWAPGRGGSGWVKVGEVQLGPLAPTTDHGVRSWGPGTRLRSGSWGAAWDGEPWGLWAVQTPGEFEAGGQARVRWGDLRAAGGADRTWDLTGAPASPWTDRWRLGWGWSPGFWRWAGDLAGEVPEKGRPTTSAGALASWRRAPWSVEARGRWSSSQPWELGGQAGWKVPLAQLSARWTRKSGAAVSADFGLPGGGFLWTAEAEGRWNHAGSLRGGFGVSGDREGGRWHLSWKAAPTETGLVQTVGASWKVDGWQAQAEWKTQNLTLGWMGPTSRFTLALSIGF